MLSTPIIVKVSLPISGSHLNQAFVAWQGFDCFFVNILVRQSSSLQSVDLSDQEVTFTYVRGFLAVSFNSGCCHFTVSCRRNNMTVFFYQGGFPAASLDLSTSWTGLLTTCLAGWGQFCFHRNLYWAPAWQQTTNNGHKEQGWQSQIIN